MIIWDFTSCWLYLTIELLLQILSCACVSIGLPTVVAWSCGNPEGRKICLALPFICLKHFTVPCFNYFQNLYHSRSFFTYILNLLTGWLVKSHIENTKNAHVYIYIYISLLCLIWKLWSLLKIQIFFAGRKQLANTLVLPTLISTTFISHQNLKPTRRYAHAIVDTEESSLPPG